MFRKSKVTRGCDVQNFASLAATEASGGEWLRNPVAFQSIAKLPRRRRQCIDTFFCGGQLIAGTSNLTFSPFKAFSRTRIRLTCSQDCAASWPSFPLSPRSPIQFFRVQSILADSHTSYRRHNNKTSRVITADLKPPLRLTQLHSSGVSEYSCCVKANYFMTTILAVLDNQIHCMYLVGTHLYCILTGHD